jgi:glutamate/tyrosine decarboxylase-like PLP-dependent enzyme
MSDSEASSGDLLARVAREAADFETSLRDGPVSQPSAVREIRERLAKYDFAAPRPADAVLGDVASMLRRWNVHVTHPRYFGLFNPSVVPAAVAAESLAAVVNLQLAVWSHSPAANEIERWTLRALASLAGFDPDATAAHFTTGGQESNLSAVVAALSRAFPRVADEGLRALAAQPVLYVSVEGHHSFVKAAGVTGLGRAAVRTVAVTKDLRLDVAALSRSIAEDRAAGRAPFLVVGTAGTTSAGVVDPLPEIADLCEREGLWFHADAAYGGGALLSPKWRHVVAGVERADSVAWDAHKWMSVPFAAGMFFCRHRDAVVAAFGVTGGYMPEPRDGCEDLHRVSLQWTRRSLGLKVFAALAERGLSGYASMIDRQVAMGDALRARLAAAGWRVVNDTPLPVVCFTHPLIAAGKTTAGRVAGAVVRGGRAWISPVKLAGGPPVLRACITSYRTTTDDLDVLVAALADALGGPDREV